MRSATRSADMPGPGRRFGQEVTMRHCRLSPSAIPGAATAPTAMVPAPSSLRRETLVALVSVMRSPPMMKMMHRPAAGSDVEPFRRRNRGGDIVLGAAHGFGESLSLGEPGGDCG